MMLCLPPDVLSELNTTIGDLKTLLAQIFLVQVDIEDNASGSLSYIDGLLSQLDGKTANVYINTLGGNTIGFTPGAATGEFIYPESARNLVAKVDGMGNGRTSPLGRRGGTGTGAAANRLHRHQRSRNPWPSRSTGAGQAIRRGRGHLQGQHHQPDHHL
jgi:hypothetical protein